MIQCCKFRIEKSKETQYLCEHCTLQATPPVAPPLPRLQLPAQLSLPQTGQWTERCHLCKCHLLSL